jgi:hypothetical protein
MTNEEPLIRQYQEGRARILLFEVLTKLATPPA